MNIQLLRSWSSARLRACPLASSDAGYGSSLTASPMQKSGKPCWVIEHLIKEHCSPIDAEEQFEELLSETCETIKIGSLEYDPGYVLRNIDPVAFRYGVSDMLADDEQYIEVDGQYYNVCDIETMIEELS